MTITRINPESMYNSLSYGFSHATLARCEAVLHLAGQVAWNRNCEIVGKDDLRAQARQVLANIRMVLHEAGASPNDVIRLRTYVVNHTPDKLQVVLAEIGEFFGDGTPAPNTFIGVEALALPAFMVEIEATASVSTTA